MKIGVVRGFNASEWDSFVFKFIKKSHSVKIINSSDSRNRLVWNKKNIISLFRFGILTEWTGYVATLFDYVLNINNWLFGLKRQLQNFDIVEASDTTHPFTYQSVKHHPLVVCLCFENIPFFREGGITKIYKNYSRKHAAYFIAVTKKAKNVLELEGVPTERISVIPPGIDTDLFKPARKDPAIMKKYGLKEKDINILFAGRLVYDKGIEDLIFAFNLLCRKHQNINLLIMGQGPLKKRISLLAKRFNISRKIIFLGFLPYEKTPSYYNCADIFCTPSKITRFWQEQFGYVFAEAMSCGKPIVSTHAGSIPEVTGGASLLVSPGNHLELSKALDRIISNKVLRTKMSKSARNIALKKYDAKKIAEKKIKLYEAIIHEKKKRN